MVKTKPTGTEPSAQLRKASPFDFEKQLTFYSSYHHNGINKLIHVIFVPTIYWTVLVFFSGYKLGYDIPVLDAPLTASYIISAVYSSYYVLLEPFAGLAYTPILFCLSYAAWAFTVKFGAGAVSIAIGVHVVSWIVQFIGHGVFEGRAPALLDNLVQALLLAPFFVFLEVLFVVFNYRPELQKRLADETRKAIEAHEASKNDGNKSKDSNGTPGSPYSSPKRSLRRAKKD